MKLDPFVSEALKAQAKELVLDGCKEKPQGPTLKAEFSINSERALVYSCKNADGSNLTCMECPVFRGKEISI